MSDPLRRALDELAEEVMMVDLRDRALATSRRRTRRRRALVSISAAVVVLGIAGGAAVLGPRLVGAPLPPGEPASQQTTSSPTVNSSATATTLALTISSSVSGTPTLHMGGAPFVFTANIVNDTASSSPPFTLLVSIGHCSCNPSPVQFAPTGAMAWNHDGAWTSIPFVREQGGMDYVTIDQGFGSLVIPSGGAMHFTLRVSFDPNSRPLTPTFVDGAGTIHVSLVQADRSFLPQVPSASLPINVVTS